VTRNGTRHEASYLLSHHHLHRLSDDIQMLRRNRSRTQNKGKSKLAPIEDQEEPDPAAPGPTESTPDLQIGTSSSAMLSTSSVAMLSTSSVATLSTSSLPSLSTSTFFPTLSTSTLPTINSSIFPTPEPFTPYVQELKGIQTASFQSIYLTTRFCATQLPLLLINFDPLLEYDKATARNSQILMLMKVHHPGGGLGGGYTTHAPSRLSTNLVEGFGDAFPPIKAVTGGLSVLANNYDVCSISSGPCRSRRSQLSKQTLKCRQMIESLVPRVIGLGVSLSVPVPKGEVKEEERRKILKR